MANKYAEFEWIRRIIRSCETFRQLRSPITRLIILFYRKHKDMGLRSLLDRERENHTLYQKTRPNITQQKQ